MYLAFRKIVPPHEYYHNPKLYNYNGYTVAILLLKNKLEVP